MTERAMIILFSLFLIMFRVPDVNDCQPRQAEVDGGASSSPAESHSLEQEYCSALLHAQFDNIEFEESGEY